MFKRSIPAIALAAVVFLGGPAAAKNQTDPSALVASALACELPNGKAKSVLAALRKLGAKPGPDEGDFNLVKPITVFGMPVTRVNVMPDNDGVDTYIAIFPGASVDTVAAAAQLKSVGGSYQRDLKNGALSADVRDRKDVWLSCTAL